MISLVLLSVTSGIAGAPEWSSLSTTSGWKEVATRNSDSGEVTVYRKEIGELTCLQGVVLTDVKPQELVDVLVDVPSATRWSSAHLAVSQLLKSSGGTLEIYQYMDVPNWTLVADRFWVLSANITPFEGGQRYRWERMPAQTAHPKIYEAAMARSSGAIEPPTNWGEWIFTPSGDKTEVRYRGCADVGGALPDGIQRWVATRTLPDSISDLVVEAKKRR